MLDGGIEADNMGNFSGGKAGDASTSFGVPEFHLPVVGRGEEVLAVVGEGYIGDGFGVAIVCPEELALVVDVPDLE